LKLRERSGFSVIEVLITPAIVIIIALTFASLTNNLLKEFKGLTQKADAAEVRKGLILAFVNSNVCSWQLQGKTIRTTGVTSKIASTTDISIPILYAGLNASSSVIAQANTKLNGSNLTVESIHLKNIYQTGLENEYTAAIHVNFDASTLAKPLKAATTQVVFLVDPTDPANARRIVGCTSEGSKSFTVLNTHLKKFHENIEIDCTNINSGKMFWDSACFRFCAPGCKPGGMSQTCTTFIPGQGYQGGIAVECSGNVKMGECLCVR
jgi:hypothetical protein